MKTTLLMLRRAAACVLIAAPLSLASDHAPASHDAPSHDSPSHDTPKPLEAKHAEPAAPTNAESKEAKPTPAAPSPAVSAGPTADESLEALKLGNGRFTSGDSDHPRQDQDRRSDTYPAQHPTAAILSCADSRVPPEIVFDTGIGDLFVIRVAGNVADTDEIATLEYGVEHLKTPLIVVMGHTKCGAVAAVVSGAELHGNLALLTDNIVPAAAKVKQESPTLKGQSLTNKVVRANVFQSIDDLISNSEIIREKLKAKEVKIVGAVYDINSGFIDWMGEHPQQEVLISSPHEKSAADSHASSKELTHDDKDAKNTHGAHGEPTKKPAENADTHKESQSSAATKTNPSAIRKYGPFGAFAVGSMALSAVAVHLVRNK